MKKSMIALLGTGLGGCLITTVLMGHLLSLEPDMKLSGKLADSFTESFASRSLRDAILVVKRPKKDELRRGEIEASVRVVARIWPRENVDVEAMIEDVADFVWKADFGDPIHEVQVRWQTPGTRRTDRRIVGRPGRRRVLRLYGPGSSR